MLIQVILIISLILLGTSLVRSRHSSRTKAYKKLLLFLAIIFAVIIVLFPDVATEIANMVGVGRGADLLLYGVTVTLIFVMLNNYIKDLENQKKLTLLARKIAILESKNNK